MNYIFLEIAIPSTPYSFESGVEKICYPLKENQTADEFIADSMTGSDILTHAVFDSGSFDNDCFKFLNSFDLVDNQVVFSLSKCKETFVRVVSFYAQKQGVSVEVDPQGLSDATSPDEVIVLWPSELNFNPYVLTE